MILEIFWNEELWNEDLTNTKTTLYIVNINMSKIKGFNWLYVERNYDENGQGIYFNLDCITCWRVLEV